MKTILAFCFALLASICAFSQNAVDNNVYTTVQQAPQFKGMDKWVDSNMEYYDQAKGTVMIGCTVEKDGSLSNIRVSQGFVNGDKAEKEAVRLVKKMPNWTPGMQDGKPVRVAMKIPISFTGGNHRPSSGKTADSNSVFTIVQQKPEFSGDVNKWLGDNIVYPVQAKNDNIQGTVWLNFIVERNGSVSNVKILRGVAGGKSLEDEATRVVSMMPTWAPGMQNGHAVRVQYCLPIHFKLDDDKAATPSDPNKVYTIVQSKPMFHGDISRYLGENVKYPEDARKNNIQGTVYVQFVIEGDGSISTVQVMRGIEGGRSLENEAVRVISAMPKWTPGMQNGVPVRVQYMVPIHFILQDNNAPANK